MFAAVLLALLITFTAMIVPGVYIHTYAGKNLLLAEKAAYRSYRQLFKAAGDSSWRIRTLAPRPHYRMLYCCAAVGQYRREAGVGDMGRTGW